MSICGKETRDADPKSGNLPYVGASLVGETRTTESGRTLIMHDLLLLAIRALAKRVALWSHYSRRKK